MQSQLSRYADLSDTDLLAAVQQFAANERRATAQLIASLAEVDARRLYLGQGCSSLFTYCTQVLHLSEHAAYGRIEAARAARRFPIILEHLADGAVTLTAVGLLAAHFTPKNHRELLAEACHRSKRDVECLVARIRPQPPVPSSVRKLPTPAAIPAAPAAPATSAADEARPPCYPFAVTVIPLPPLQEASTAVAAEASPPPLRRAGAAVVAPLTPERYKIQVTVSGDTVAKLRRAQDLLHHAVPGGDLAVILDRALTALLDHLARTKLAGTNAPRPGRATGLGSRHIPAAVKRAVWARDEGRCAFVGPAGRCTEQGFLEFHHVIPYIAGGDATVDTIALRCRAHNLYEAELDFGTRASKYRARRARQPSALRERREPFGAQVSACVRGIRYGLTVDTAALACVAYASPSSRRHREDSVRTRADT